MPDPACLEMERPTVAEPEDELFDIYDEHGTWLGVQKRAIVHTLGLYHRAVYCFVFNSSGKLLIQRRSLEKRVGPGQWDLSVAEHLQPGESYPAAVTRGLMEELGIEADSVVGPINAVHTRKLVVPGLVTDYEFVESYMLEGYNGTPSINPAEVTDIKFVDMKYLKDKFAEEPDQFTQWFREELAALNFFESRVQTTV